MVIVSLSFSFSSMPFFIFLIVIWRIIVLIIFVFFFIVIVLLILLYFDFLCLSDSNLKNYCHHNITFFFIGIVLIIYYILTFAFWLLISSLVRLKGNRIDDSPMNNNNNNNNNILVPQFWDRLWILDKFLGQLWILLWSAVIFMLQGMDSAKTRNGIKQRILLNSAVIDEWGLLTMVAINIMLESKPQVFKQVIYKLGCLSHSLGVL